jgi:hypothetical protein
MSKEGSGGCGPGSFRRHAESAIQQQKYFQKGCIFPFTLATGYVYNTTPLREALKEHIGLDKKEASS